MAKGKVPFRMCIACKQMKPKKEIQTMGSMKSTASDKGVKDYYSPDEIFAKIEALVEPLL